MITTWHIKALEFLRQVLARKMTVLYKLAQDQLSKQLHYDFGLRAIKSVLVIAGSLRRFAAKEAEHEVLMRSLRDANVPKLVAQDMPLFLGLLSDLFPGAQLRSRVTAPALYLPCVFHLVSSYRICSR